MSNVCVISGRSLAKSHHRLFMAFAYGDSKEEADRKLHPLNSKGQSLSNGNPWKRVMYFLSLYLPCQGSALHLVSQLAASEPTLSC